MTENEHVKLLLAKAEQDEFVLARFSEDNEAPVEVFGFHAQQAAEKLIKAAIVAAGGKYPMTHRLEELIELGKDLGIPWPAEFEDLDTLTPYAVEFRYDIFPADSETPLNRRETREMISRLRAWVVKFASSLNPSR
jgi:HEPN domain-containing protein